MEVTDFFIKLLVILLSAKFFAELFVYFRLPAVLGEVMAGILIGPSLLGFIEPDATLHLLAQIGILLLLFEVGLETDVAGIMKVGFQATLVATTGVVLPALGGFFVAYSWFGLSLITSLFVAGTIVATSIGITVRVLSDLKKQNTVVSQIVVGAAVLDDVVGVVVLALVYDFSVNGVVSIGAAMKVLGFISLFLLVAPVLAKLLVPLVAKLSSAAKTKGMLPTLIVCMILGLAAISHRIGAPEILGAFAAGIALDKRFFISFSRSLDHYSGQVQDKIDESMTPVIDLFVPVFFVMVGASINFRMFDVTSTSFLVFVGGLSVVAILTKMLSGLWVKGGWSCKAATGMAMVPRGEVGLIFAEVGRSNKIFDEATYAAIVCVVAVTTLLAPIALRFLMKDLPDTCSSP